MFASALAQPGWDTIIFASLHLGEACLNLSVMTHKRNKNDCVQVIIHACILTGLVSIAQKKKGEKGEFKSINRHLLKGQLNFICFSFFPNILGKTIFGFGLVSLLLDGITEVGGGMGHIKLTFDQTYSCCLISPYHCFFFFFYKFYQ